MNLLRNTTLQKFHFSKKIDLVENDIETHIQRIERGLNTDFIEVHNLFDNEN